MIKRKYYFSVKVAHNDNSGEYSWWNNIIVTSGWFANPQQALDDLRDAAVNELCARVTRDIYTEDIEIISFSRV